MGYNATAIESRYARTLFSPVDPSVRVFLFAGAVGARPVASSPSSTLQGFAPTEPFPRRRGPFPESWVLKAEG